MDDTVGGNVVGGNDPSSHVARGDESTSVVSREGDLLTAGSGGTGNVSDGSRVDNGAIDEVVEEDSSLGLGGSGSNGVLGSLEGSVVGSEDGDGIGRVKGLNKVELLEELGKLAGTKSAGNGGGVAGDGENRLDGLNTDVLVGGAIISDGERDVAAGLLDVSSVVARLLAKDNDLSAVVGELDVVLTGEGGGSNDLAVSANVANADSAVQNVVSDGSNESVGGYIAKGVERGVAGSKDGLVATLEGRELWEAKKGPLEIRALKKDHARWGSDLREPQHWPQRHQQGRRGCWP